MEQNEFNGFTWDVAKEYGDLLSTTIPNYKAVNDIIVGIVGNYVNQDNGSMVYDLGAAPGLLMESILSNYPQLRYYAVDLHLPMLDILNSKLTTLSSLNNNISARVQPWDLNNNREAGHDFVSVILANYIFSYLIPTSRLPIIKNSYQELKPGGCMVVCDIVGLGSVSKMVPNETLQPQTLEQTIALLKEAGFEESKINVFYKMGDFAGIVATK